MTFADLLTRIAAELALFSAVGFLLFAINAWVLRRVHRVQGPIEVRRNRVYIVPTRLGWLFGASFERVREPADR